ncbi:MAG: ATP-dependent DNA helicase, partial [Jatrophihabitantaceae bacterium]
MVEGAIAAEDKPLGADQINAVSVLCGAGPSVRALVAPAGFGKTTTLHAAARASETAGRQVIALAPTHKAVAELRAAGLDATTIAQFRRHLTDTVAARTTVIVDEVSLVGTRDAAALIEAVAGMPRAQVWFVGDGRQAQSVAAGGLCVELERLAADGTIAMASLSENRRQRDPAERAALAQFRAGDVEASQTIRTAHGWEHQHPHPAETRQALAETAVVDADHHGAEHVAVLAVSHADCEDLTDRIRAIRTARGELRGPTLTGPAWGTDLRVYAAGDRILLHANLDARRQVCNGSTGIVLAVGGAGLEVRFDNGHVAVIAAAAVAGTRPDGTPNLSHAWARTIEGAQGGTWHQVHLLGTPTLNQYTGYTGQSRGTHPTQTWTTRPEPDHPFNLLADERDASETVLDALRRGEPKTFAAIDDPWTLDRQLRTERDEHRTVIATRPPEPSRTLDHARATLARALEEQHYAVKGIMLREDERATLGPLTRLRRGGRDVIAQHDEALTVAHRRLAHAQQAVHDAQLTANRLETATAELA